MKSEELLQLLEKHDIITADAVQEIIEMENRKKILQQHKSEIWQGKNGRWYTYLPDSTKRSGRRQIAKSTREKLENTIVAFYSQLSAEQIMTFKKCFFHWIEVQKADVKQNTITRYMQDYRRCILGTDFEVLPISDITTETVKVFIGNCIKEKELTTRAYTNLVGYLNGVFRSALENDFIQKNPMITYQVSRQLKNCKQSLKRAEDVTVSNEEMHKIYKVIDEKLQKTPHNMCLYAILLASLTGMRVGELSALAWKNVYWDKGYILICQAEERITEEGKPCKYTIGLPKGGKEREIPLTPEMKSLLRFIRHLQEKMQITPQYVFENTSGRVHKTAIVSCADSVSRRAGVPNKSIHCYRRTLSSKLHHDSLLSGLQISSVLGHSETVNARHYSYDTSHMSEKQEALSKANRQVIDLTDYKESAVIKNVIKTGNL